MNISSREIAIMGLLYIHYVLFSFLWLKESLKPLKQKRQHSLCTILSAKESYYPANTRDWSSNLISAKLMESRLRGACVARVLQRERSGGWQAQQLNRKIKSEQTRNSQADTIGWKRKEKRKSLGGWGGETKGRKILPVGPGGRWCKLIWAKWDVTNL